MQMNRSVHLASSVVTKGSYVMCEPYHLLCVVRSEEKCVLLHRTATVQLACRRNRKEIEIRYHCWPHSFIESSVCLLQYEKLLQR